MVKRDFQCSTCGWRYETLGESMACCSPDGAYFRCPSCGESRLNLTDARMCCFDEQIFTDDTEEV